MRWPDAVEAAVERAVAAVFDGIPTVLDISGEPGFGKSTLARWIAQRFPPENVVRATAYPGDEADALGIVRQLQHEVSDEDTDPLRVSRRLGQHLDRIQLTGPVVVVLDDVQWADPESLDAIGVLLERMAGDRVLVVSAHRQGGRMSTRWSSHVDRAPSAVRIVLEGLDEQSAFELVREAAPTVSPALAAQLARHTGGNPLFLRSIVHEHSLAQLQEMADAGRLPAPSELARSLNQRLSELDTEVVVVLDSLAVLGDSGADILVLAAVADVADVDQALALLKAEGLVVIDGSVPARARIFHGVIRAAVYEGMSPTVRQRMHGRAAARSTSPRERLGHRVAAARTADEGLAFDLDAFADELHAQRRFRRAAGVRRQAAAFSNDVDARTLREREADFEAILAYDMDGLADSVGVAEDLDPRGRFTLGARHVVEGRYVDAAALLGSLNDDDLDLLGELTAYRARVLRGWAFISSGINPDLAFADLSVAAESSVQDPALEGFFSIAYGQAAIAAARPERRRSLSDLLETSRGRLATTPRGLTELAWRGAATSLSGLQKVAIGDLDIVVSRLGDGIVDFGDGAFFALQGLAYTFDGQWGRAAISFDLARTARAAAIAPMTTALLALGPLLRGDESQTREALAESRRGRVRSPQPSAVHGGDIVEVVALMVFGTHEERRTWLGRREVDFGAVDPDRDVGPLLWCVVHAVAQTWSGRPSDAGRWADAVRREPAIPWAEPVADWLDARGLDDDAFLTRADQILRAGLPEAPFIDALIQLDAAERATGVERQGRRSQLTRSLIGFGGDRLAATLFPEEAEQKRNTPGSALLELLSDREREIATLLVEGLSYAQISRELFITRSTVSYHLTRIYAKTGTSSRHDLAQAYAASRARNGPE